MTMLLCIYDFPKASNLFEVGKFIEFLNTALGLRLDSIEVAYNGGRPGPQLRYAGATTLLACDNEKFFGLSAFELASVVPGAGTLRAENYVGFARDSYWNYLYAVARDVTCKDVSLRVSQAPHLWKSVCKGYGFARDLASGEDPYAIVTGSNETNENSTDAELQAILLGEDPGSKWADIYVTPQGKKAHLSGYFRDLYEVNFIRGSHLAHMVRGMSLGERIDFEGQVFGHVVEISKDCFVWIVTEDRVFEVREFLDQAGLLLCRG
ncbi:MAG: hypothetical protein KBA31_20535 [Alphaproteobacteria bacterium]|nr:hypothetical protein [Alphaproteobacteria bacterium]